MENVTQFERDEPLPKPIEESKIKSKTVMSYSSRKKKKTFFETVYFVLWQFF